MFCRQFTFKMLFVVTLFLLIKITLESQDADSRRKFLLDPYRLLSIDPPAQPTQRLDEANAFSIQNINRGENRLVNRKDDSKESYQNYLKLPFASRIDLPKALQNNPYVKVFGLKTQGLAIPPLRGVKTLLLALKERAKSAKQNGGILSNHEKDTDILSNLFSTLRGRFSKKCGKAAAKECKKACTRALKSTCSDYRCEKHLKKKFRKECKIQCTRRFVKHGGGDME